MSDESRRKLLKTIAAGSGAIVVGKSLPEKWARPVVDSVILPAHAETSPLAPPPSSPPPPALSCIGSQLNIPNGENGVAVHYDGDTTCSLSSTSSTDVMLVVDLDQLDGTDIVIAAGSNWDTRTVIYEVDDGTYTYQATRNTAPNAGTAFDVTVTFSTSGANPNKSLTVTLDNLVPA